MGGNRGDRVASVCRRVFVTDHILSDQSASRLITGASWTMSSDLRVIPVVAVRMLPSSTSS